MTTQTNPTPEDNYWANKETGAVQFFIRSNTSVRNLANKIIKISESPADSADSLTHFFWTLWEGEIPSEVLAIDPRASLLPVSWKEIVESTVDNELQPIDSE